MTRPPDLAWEALVKETAANPAVERGQLNVALKAIREAAQTEGLHPDDLPHEIELRAARYREAFPGLTLTPMALAKHWFRVLVKHDSRTPQQRALDDLRREQE